MCIEASDAARHQGYHAQQIDLCTFREVREIHDNGTVEGITTYDNRTDQETRVDMDAVLCFLGFKPDPGPKDGPDRNRIRRSGYRSQQRGPLYQSERTCEPGALYPPRCL